MSKLKGKLPAGFSDMHKDNRRSGAMDFMKSFKVMVRNGKRLPDDWVLYAAELLGAAANAAEEPDSKKRATAIMKAMSLSGRVDKGERDYKIARAMLYLIELKGMTHIKAKTHLSLELEDYGVAVPEETLISIFKRVPREEVEAGLYSVATSLIHLDEDLAEYLCNYEALARYFR